jgi:hypothetical protein
LIFETVLSNNLEKSYTFSQTCFPNAKLTCMYRISVL